MTAASQAQVRAPAKLNLGLAVTDVRADGYHELRSVFVRIGLVDRLSGAVDRTLTADRLRIEGADELEPSEDIALRAVGLVRREIDASLPALELTLDKRIPIGAGLGGGSSDAAAAIALAAQLWGLELAGDVRARLAAGLGADVPFFAGAAPVARVSGIGDRLEPLPPVIGQPGFLLVTPAARLATRSVFGEFDRTPHAGSSSIRAVDALAAALSVGIDGAGLAAIAGTLRDANDLWLAALELAPELGRLRSQLEGALGRPVLMSGSGSTLFAVYASSAAAATALAALRRDQPELVAGARLVAAAELDRDDQTRRER